MSVPNPRRRLWEDAFDRIKTRDPEKAAKYQKVLLEGIQGSSSDKLGTCMAKVVETKLEILKRSGDSRFQKQFDRIVRLITLVQNLGNVLAAGEPLHAGLPWAGVCFLLTVSTFKASLKVFNMSKLVTAEGTVCML
jgi:hypothetical protein